MARFEFKQDPPPLETLELAERRLGLKVRYFGLGLMAVGLLVSLTVIISAWILYLSPTHIESFAQAVEQGSHLDLTLSRATQQGQQQFETRDRAGLAATPRSADAVSTAAASGFRFSYFMAWLLAILLLMLIGHLGIAAVRTGGQLVLHDVDVRKLLRGGKKAE